MTIRSWTDHIGSIAADAQLCERHIRDTLLACAIAMKTEDARDIARLSGSLDAAAVVAAIARASECDAIHLTSCITPSAAVVPVALAFGADRQSIFRAVAGGVSAGITLGAAIGGTKTLASGVWPTLLAAPVMAATAATLAKGYGPEHLARALATALASCDGKVSDPTQRWAMFAQGIARGIAAAEAPNIEAGLLSREFLAQRAGHDAIAMEAFERPPAMAETSFKPFPIARQGLNAVEAFQTILARGFEPGAIESIEVFVPPVNLALLQRPVSPAHRLTRLCNMGFQLALAALAPQQLGNPEREATPLLMDFAARVSVHGDPALNTHLPARWPARVKVAAKGRVAEETLIASAFDWDAPRLSQSLTAKWARLSPDENLADTDLAALWQRTLSRVRMAAAHEG